MLAHPGQSTFRRVQRVRSKGGLPGPGKRPWLLGLRGLGLVSLLRHHNEINNLVAISAISRFLKGDPEVILYGFRTGSYAAPDVVATAQRLERQPNPHRGLYVLCRIEHGKRQNLRRPNGRAG
jgi:hypothetical protein